MNCYNCNKLDGQKWLFMPKMGGFRFFYDKTVIKLNGKDLFRKMAGIGFLLVFRLRPFNPGHTDFHDAASVHFGDFKPVAVVFE